MKSNFDTTMHMTFRETIDNVLKKYSEKTAITYMRNNGEDTKLSFSDVENFLHMTEKSIGEYGLQKGDRVAIISPHSPWAAFTGISLAYAGITIVLIDASLPQEEIKKLLDFSEVKAWFTTEEMYHRFEQDIKIPCFSLEQGLTLALLNEGTTDASEYVQVTKPDMDVIAILYSSGTTGQMKGIMVTYESVLKAREVFERLSGLKDYMKYLLVLPFNHIAGFTGAMTFFLTGCELGFIEDVNALKLQSGLLKFQPHYFAMVPKVYEVMEQKIRATIHEKGKGAEILMNTMFKISKFFRKHFGINIGRKMFKGITQKVFGENIFGIGTGASPCKDETTEFFLNLGLEWANLYATTETSVPIVATGIHDRYPVGTVGNVMHHPEIQIEINNPDNDGIGEIMVKSELMMKGYFKRPDLTAEAFENDFFKTGDYGYIDKKGYLHITGRIKESIVLQNGKKVSPADVDDYYLAKITDYDIASRGILNEKEACDEIHMFIANGEYSSFEQNEIKALFEEISRNAPSMYKLSGIHFASDIPRTSVGKVKRFCLKQEDAVVVESVKKSDNSETPNLIEIISKHCNGVEVTFESKIVDDLGLDSLTIFTIVCEIEEAYGVDIAAELEQLVTVKDVDDLLDGKNRVLNTENIANYPLKRTERDYKKYDRFMKTSKRLWNFDVTGIENITPDENYIFCPNHESHYDGAWVIGNLDDRIKHSICSIAADYLFEKKIYRAGLIRMGGIPVHRSGNTTTAMKRAYECISKEGYSLLIHPEGTRTRNGELGEFKQGAAKLSVDTGVKIVPVCIDGAYEMFPPSRPIPRLFDWKHFCKYTLKIKFGTPIVPDGLTAEELTTKIRQDIVEMKSELKG